MKSSTGALVAVALAAVVSLMLIPVSHAMGPHGVARGIFCNTAAVLNLPNPDAGSGVPPAPQYVTMAPFTAVDLEVPQGQALLAAGLVSPGLLLPYLGGTWFGAFCPGFQSPRLVGVTIVPVVGADGKPFMVNSIGLHLPGDPGAIYQLATAK